MNTTAREAFEAIMRVDGHTEFTRKGEGYANQNMQMRWRWFLTGWEMRGVAK